MYKIIHGLTAPHSRKGFTLIEMLIVIAIIGILASIVLVGLGPIQRQGRDARRQSDLRNTQNALELYFNRCTHYPGGANCTDSTASDWDDMAAAITGSSIGVNQIPNDPSTNRDYFYGTDGDQSTYVIGAELEDENNPSLRDDVDGNVLGVDCEDPVYCIQF